MKNFALCGCRGSAPHRDEIRMRAKNPSVERILSFLSSSAISLRRDAQVWLWRGFEFKSINRILNKKLRVSNNFQSMSISTLGQ